MTTHLKARFAAPLLAVVVSISAIPSKSEAALTAYESFDYVSGALTGQTGGTGWNAGWTSSGTGSGATVSSPGLNYTDSNSAVLDVQGSKLDLLGNGSGNFRVPTSSVDTSGSTLYISFLAQLTTTGGYSGFSLFQGATENLFLGVPNTRTFWGIDSKTGTVSVSTTPVTTLSLLVYRIDFGATTTVSLYVNPTLGTEPATAAVTVTRTAFTWDSIRIQSGTNVGAIDEVRIGTDFNSVAPIPEPSAILAVIGGLGILLMRRRS